MGFFVFFLYMDLRLLVCVLQVKMMVVRDKDVWGPKVLVEALRFLRIFQSPQFITNTHMMSKSLNFFL